MRTQLNRGLQRRLMYVESKEGLIDGVPARIGWVTFSRSGATVYYRGRTLTKGCVDRGNFFDADTGEDFWVSGVKRRGSNSHPADAKITITIDADALDGYEAIKAG